MNIRHLVAGATLAIAALGSAHASVPYVSPASGTIAINTFDGAGFFSTSAFTLNHQAYFSLTISTFEDDDTTPISASLYSYAAGGYLTGLGSLDDTGTEFTLDFGSIAAGSYRVDVTGTPGADVYVGYTTAAPVPEPESIALLLAGLGVVGFSLARRRA